MLGGSQPETTVDVDKNTIARTGALSADELVPEHTKLIPHDLLRCFGLDEARLVAANEAVNRSSDGSGSKGSGPGGQGHAQYGGPSSRLPPLARRPSYGAQQLQPARETSRRRAATKHAGLGGDAAPAAGLAKRGRVASHDGAGLSELHNGVEEGGAATTGGGPEGGAPGKRPRLAWTPQLHKRFVDAVSHLGLKTAVPKTIMQLMNVDGLTRENVASHLQKYRLYIQRLQGSGGSTRSGSKQDSMMDFEDGDDAVEAEAGDAEDMVGA